MSGTPDIPFSTNLRTIVNAAGNSYTFAMIARDWKTYNAISPAGASEECIVVDYQSDPITLIGHADTPTVQIIVAWNLASDRTLVGTHIDMLAEALGYYYLGQSIDGNPVRPEPVVWPLTASALSGASTAFFRGPLRYIKPVTTSVAAFVDWVPGMNV